MGAAGASGSASVEGVAASVGSTSELEQHIQRADASARELAETLAACKPLIEQQARAQARGAQLERERQRLEKACASLEERCGMLDGQLRERESRLEQVLHELALLEARDEESARSLASAHVEISTLRHDLDSERQHLERERERAERESLACEELQRARDEQARKLAQLEASLERARAAQASPASWTARARASNRSRSSARSSRRAGTSRPRWCRRRARCCTRAKRRSSACARASDRWRPS